LFNVNIKARINRHSRIFKENILNKSGKKLHKGHWYNIVILIFLFVIPIYPAFAWLVYTNTEYDFYRGDIDESSIIDSYSINNNSEDSLILESKDSFLSVNTLDDNWRDLSWTNEIINYEVQSWDSVWSIANKFEVSTNSIFWANWFSSNHMIHPWDKIKVPPVSWLVHYVQKWENIDSIAKKYWIDKKSILEQNLIQNNKNLVAWEVLVIPWAIKKSEPKSIIDNRIQYKNNLTKNSNKKFNNKNLTPSKNWEYNLTWRAPKWKFYWWNCTWYVAQYKNVDWSWNAKNWLANAKAKWHKTSSEPSAWAIIVFSWRWYNPTYWHVWIVTSVNWNNLIISDMNYRRLWEVTSRKISKNDSAIRWYIIVN